jgi:chemotaxis response regulator CheB
MRVQLNDIAKALRQIADQIEEAAGERKPAGKPPVETTAKPVKLEDVRAVLTTLSSSQGAAAVKALLKDFGAEKLSDIAAQDYPELLAKAQEMGRG